MQNPPARSRFDIGRRHLLGGAVGLAGLALTGRSARAAAEAGTLTLYNGQHRSTTEALVAAFTDATGIKVVIRNAESPELASQIVEEGVNSPADLFYSEQSPPIASLQERGMLARIDPATLAAIPAKFSAKDGTWLGASVRTRVVTYNKNLISGDALPKSIMEIVSPAFADKVAYVKRDGFQEQVMAIERIKGPEAALGWLRALKQNGRSYNGNRIATTAVENGEIAMALSNNYYWYSLARERGGADKLNSALYTFPGDDAGNIFNVSAAGILKSSKNQELAQKFLAFIVTRPAQEAMAKTSAEYPVLADVPSPFPLPPLSSFSAPVTPADMGSAAEAYALERQVGMI